MRILLILPRIPYPTYDGGSLAMFQSIEMYKKKGFEVSILALNTNKHWVGEEDYPPLFRQVDFHSVSVNTDVKAWSAFINLFGRKSYNVDRFVDKEVDKELIHILKREEYDIIQFESIYTSPYLQTAREYSDAKCFCRVHNIEHHIWHRYAENERNVFKKKYLNLLTDRLRKYEIDVLSKFDLLLSISEEENAFIRELGVETPVYYLPYCIEKIRVNRSQIPLEKNSIYHIGSMDWFPNVEAMEWFVDHVWDDLHKKHPLLKFYMAGKNMPLSFMKLARKNIEVVGEISDVIGFSLSRNILIVPLQSGAGMRIKVIKAMALGKAIISTSIGVEGINVQNGVHCLIANTKEEFIKEISRCLSNPELAVSLGKAAEEFAITFFEQDEVYKRFISFIKETYTA